MAQLTTSYQKIAQGTAKKFDATTSRVDIYAKYNSQDIANNTTNYSVQLRLVKVSGGYIGEYSGTTVKTSATDIATSTVSGGTGDFTNKTFTAISGTTRHNDDGTKTVSMSGSMYFKTWGITLNVSGSATLPAIPRKPNITSFSVSKRDETSVLFNWTADSTCDYAKYSKDNGSTWYDLPANNIVTGLSAGTTYNFKLQVRRQDSQQWSDASATSQQTTYPYPSCTSENKDFTIGQDVQLTFNNPRNVSFQIQMWSHRSQQFVTDLITINPATNVPYTLTLDANRLYNSIPSNTDSKYNIDVWYNGNKAVKTAGTYYLNQDANKPTFENYTWSTDLSDFTGDNDTVINGKTNTTVTISSANKAIAKNGATMQRYTVQCGNQEIKTLNYSTSDLSTVLNNCNSDILKVTAIDSRGLETPVTKTISNFKDYFVPTFMSYNVERQNGIDTIVHLNLSLQFWNSNFGDGENILKSLKYRVKTQSSSQWGDWLPINVSSLTISGNNVTGNNILIYSDSQSSGFAVGTAYNIQLQVIDGTADDALSTVESAVFDLTDGQVAFSVLKDNNGLYHLGINGMSDDDYMLVANDNPIIDNNGNLIGGGTAIPQQANPPSNPSTNDLWIDTDDISSDYSNIYSLTEQKIGKWIDGKPLYRKVVSYTMGSNETTKTVSTGLSNVSKFVTCTARIIRAGDYNQNSNIGEYFMSSSDYFNCYMDTPNAKTVNVRGGNDWPKRPYDFVLILEYTKTTD